MKILIAADGSPYTRRVLDYLASHPEFIEGHQEYVVLNVVAAVPARAASSVTKELLDSYYDDEAERVFKPIRAFFKKQSLNADFVSKVGHAADVIGKVAKQGKFDLLIMGSRGHGAVASLLMGSVAVKVLGHCDTPVLLVR
jgi:nucleotide-binding universal stress UspA family protein